MDKELDLRQVFYIIRSRFLAIFLVTIAGGLIAFAITYFLVTPMYTASVSMYVTNNENRSDTSITNGDLTASQGLVDTYIVVLESDTLLSNTAKELPYNYTTDELRNMISAEAINDTEAFRVKVQNADPKEAQQIANTIAKTAPDEIKRVVKAGAVEVIDYAKLPDKADWPVTRNTAIGLLCGFMLAIIYAVLKAMLDTTIRSSEDLTERYELPVLGTIPMIQSAKFEEKQAKGREAEQ